MRKETRKTFSVSYVAREALRVVCDRVNNPQQPWEVTDLLTGRVTLGRTRKAAIEAAKMGRY